MRWIEKKKINEFNEMSFVFEIIMVWLEHKVIKIVFCWFEIERERESNVCTHINATNLILKNNQ